MSIKVNLKFAHYLNHTVGELEYRLSHVNETCKISEARFLAQQEQIKGDGAVINYHFSAFSSLVQTFKDILPIVSGNKVPWSALSKVRHIDFMPTILEMLDIPINTSFEKLDGKSLMPIINGQNISEEFAFSETGNPLNEKAPPKTPNIKSIRNSKWKLIHNEHDNTKELYDLQNDPSEENNLIGKNFEIEKELSKELLKHTNE